jgi:hypothetical protein
METALEVTTGDSASARLVIASSTMWRAILTLLRSGPRSSTAK